jgi:tetratricopeptide (TPR) repeat protein/predicted Ser/Thr protein kinase
VDEEPTLQAPTQPPPPVDHYVLIERLGQGGMGDVWRARDTRLDRDVAIKLLRYAEPDDVRRFVREALMAAKLAHPNIAPVYQATDRYIAMQLVDGTTLHRHPRRDPKEIARIVRDAARALDYAHRQGVVHRDLKPDNIMIDRDGRAYVMDFGLARTIAVQSSMSASGLLVGTPAFMPPEQAVGRGDQVDARADVYALGATLYTVFAGRPPFNDDDVITLLTRVVNDEPEPLRRLKPSLDPDLESIVMKCLEKDRALRYNTAEALAQDLDRWITGQPVLARPPSLARRVKRAVARSRAVLGAVAIAVVAAVTVAIILVPKWLHASRELADRLEREKRRAEAETRARVHLESGRGLIDQIKLQRQDPGYTNDGLRALAERAEAAYRKAFDAVPDHAEAHLGIARAWVEVFDYARGRASLDRAIASAPDFATPYLERLRLNAMTYEELGHDRNERGEVSPELPRIEAALRADLDHVRRCAKDAAELDLAQGHMAFARGDYAACEKALSAYLAGFPQDLPALRCRGHALYHLRRWSEAMDVLTRALRLDARDAQMLIFRSSCLEHAGKLDAAILDLDRALEIDPRRNVFGRRARLRGRLGDSTGALADLDRAIEKQPDNWLWRLDRAELRRLKGDLAGALADVDAAARVRPDDASVALHRAYVLADRGDFDGAIAALARASDGESLLERASLRRRKRDFDGALSDLDRAIAADPNNSDILVQRGTVEWDRGDLEAAEQAWSRAIEMDKLSYAAFANRGLARAKRKDLAGAVDDFTAALAVHPTFWLALFNRSLAREDLGELDGAIDDMTRAIAQRPREARQYWLRSFQRFKKKDFDGALADLDKVLELSPDDAGALGERGMLHLQRNDAKRALADFERLVSLRPTHGTSYAGRAKARHATGDRKGAVEDARRAVELGVPDELRPDLARILREP